MGNLVSVIMSVYNEHPVQLKESIESILAQSYKNIEYVIILDNPSNLELKEIILKYKKTDPRIKFYINEKNIGLVKSLNYALSLAEGKYIARMDADDISVSNRLEIQLKFIEKNNVDFVFSNVTYINEIGEELGKSQSNNLSPDDVEKKLRILNISNHPTWFVKKEVYEKLNGYRDIPYCEDYDFSLRTLHYGFKIGKMNDFLLNYRVRENSVSRSYALKQFLNMRTVAKTYRKNIIVDYTKLYIKLSAHAKLTSKEEKAFKAGAVYFNDGVKKINQKMYIIAISKFLISIIKSKYYIYKIFDFSNLFISDLLRKKSIQQEV